MSNPKHSKDTPRAGHAARAGPPEVAADAAHALMGGRDFAGSAFASSGLAQAGELHRVVIVDGGAGGVELAAALTVWSALVPGDGPRGKGMPIAARSDVPPSLNVTRGLPWHFVDSP